MAEVLVVYGTRYGHTARLAERVASVLRSAGHEVEVRDARSKPNLEPHYQAVIVGASVHATGYEPEVRHWVQSHIDELAARPNGFFSVSLISPTHDEARDPQVRHLMERFFTQTGWHPMHLAVFAGALEYSKYNPIVRLAMKASVRHEDHGRYLDTSHDYDLTDYAHVDVFAHDFAGHLQRRELHPTGQQPTSP